jgi:hypothetical protein
VIKVAWGNENSTPRTPCVQKQKREIPWFSGTSKQCLKADQLGIRDWVGSGVYGVRLGGVTTGWNQGLGPSEKTIRWGQNLSLGGIFFFFAVVGFELRALCLLGRWLYCLATLPAIHFCSSYFGDRVLLLALLA